MKLIKLVIVAIPALFIIACGTTPPVTPPTSPTPAASPVAAATPTPDPMAATREFYSDNCESCHQDNGEGGVVKIEGKKLNVPPLTKGHALGHTDEEFTKQISKGGDGMPAFGDKMKPEEISSMIQYIRTTFQKGAPVKESRKPAVPPATP
jgi:mono/diheme cytochrome c family protein